MKSTFAKVTAAVGAAIVAAGLYVALTASNGETRYKRPGPNAGAQAQAFWDFFWTGPETQDAEGKWHANRCYFPLIGAQAPPLPPTPDPCVKPKMCVPRSPAASGYFSPAIFACAATPDGCYVDQAGTQQPRRLNKVGYIFGMGSAHAPCIVGTDGVCYGLGDQCPIQPSTPTPVVTRTPTPPPVPTAPPGTSPTPCAVVCTPTPVCPCVTRTP